MSELLSGTPARLYTTAEAASQLSMSPEWLKKQVQHRRVRHVRLGRSVRFTDDHIAAIIAAREQPVIRSQGGQRSKL